MVRTEIDNKIEIEIETAGETEAACAAAAIGARWNQLSDVSTGTRWILFGCTVIVGMCLCGCVLLLLHYGTNY